MAIPEKELFTATSHLPGAGLGLFTRQPVLKGTLIIEYKGNITTWKKVIEGKSFNGYVYYFTRNKVVDAKRTLSALARYANDARGIGRIKGISNNAVYFEKDKKVYIQATKNIAAGEEIFVAYGKEYWDAIKENIKIDKTAKR